MGYSAPACPGRFVSAPHSPDPAPATTADESTRRPTTAAPRDFSDLAKRISGRTTDLFAMALVVVVLLYLGTRVMQWWRAEPPTIAAGPTDAPLAIWDDPANLAVEFDGGPWKLSRSTASGTAEEVTRAALDHARRTLDSLQAVQLPPPDAAEQQWLQQLRNWPPQAQTEHGEIFVLGGPWPWIVATQSAFMGTAETRDASHAADSRRVLCWAFALPNSPQHWTLYTAVRASDSATNTSAAESVIPEDAQRLLTAHSSLGGITSFRSDGSLRRVQDDWNRQLTAAGWRLLNEWAGDDEIMRATFKRQTGDTPERLEAALTQDANGITTGLADWRRE